MAKENAVTRALAPKKEKPKYNVRVEGKWIYYQPTVFPAHEVAEWGGRWNKKTQEYRLPRLARLARRIREYDPDARFTTDALRIANQSWDIVPEDVALRVSEADTHPSFAKLYPFQQTGVGALCLRGFHGEMLALSPGLGKTPTSIVAADLIGGDREEKRILVVCPLSLTNNWFREITGTQLRDPITWSSDPSAEIVHQEGPGEDVRWTITNYDTCMERVQDQLTGHWTATGRLKEEFELDWDVVIFDESVLLKNRKSKRTMTCRTLAHYAKHVWLLSGAPITRDNSDIWSQFNIMEPQFFSAFWRFTNEFCVVVKTPWSQGEIMGSRKDIQVREEFPDLMFVRNQEEVLPDLPEYIFQDIELPLHPKQQKAHDDIMSVWFHELEENRDKRVDVTAVIAMLIRLQQVTSNLYNLETTGTPWPDISSKADFVEEKLDEGEIEWPVLIWTHHRPGAFALYQRLLKAAKGKGKMKKQSAMLDRRVELVYGGVKGADDIIEAYKAGDVDVLILGIQVGKYGHTLVNTRTVIPYDKTWDSDAWFQMLHRVRRNGLRHRPLVLNPRCRGTVDDFVELNLAGKLPAMARLTGADLLKVLRSLGKEHADV